MEVMTHSSTFLLPSPPPGEDRPVLTFALVVLNQRLPRFAPLLWKHAKMRLCADGGANRIYDEMPEMFPDQDPLDVRFRYKPDVIKGDMDSIRAEVKEFYTNLGVKVVDESHDQDTTDLHKCVAFICDCTSDQEKSNLCILVAGALGGRFDHEVGNINVLYRFSNIRIILLSDDCLIHLLPKTHRHEIHIQSSVEGPHCGLIPVGTPSAGTTTSGLQWDLRSNVVYDDSVNLRNILWLAPLPSNVTKAWVAPGTLVVLDAHPDGIIYTKLVPEYVDYVRTIYEDDSGEVVSDVNYLNVGNVVPRNRIFIC